MIHSIRQRINKLYHANTPDWQRWEELDELSRHCAALADSLLDDGFFDDEDDGYCFDDEDSNIRLYVEDRGT